MWQYNDPNALMHYGIKGMKWYGYSANINAY